jgi:hypothetical protein
MNRRVVINSILGGVFVASLVGVAAGMYYLRTAALAAYANEKGQAEWDRWRDDVAKEAKAFEDAAKSGSGADAGPLPPVKRRVSKSPEPPALLMMRDRFGVCLAAALLLSGAMIGSILFLVRGALLGSAPPELTKPTVD